MDITLIVFLILLYSLVTGGLSATLAEKKNHNAGSWFLIGLLFGIFGLIAAAGLPLQLSESKEISTTNKTCPQCYEEIKFQAIVCKYCGYHFSEQDNISENNISEDVISQLLTLLRSKNVKDRLYALEVIRNTKNRNFLKELLLILERAELEYLYDTVNREKVIKETEKTIAEIGDTSIIPNIIELFEESDDNFLKKHLIETLGLLGDGKAMPLLLSSLDKISLYYKAKEAIIRIGENAIPYLIEYRDKETKRRRIKLANKLINEIKEK